MTIVLEFVAVGRGGGEVSKKGRLAPAFDLTLASYPLASGFRAARVDGKGANITRQDFIKLAAA